MKPNEALDAAFTEAVDAYLAFDSGDGDPDDLQRAIEKYAGLAVITASKATRQVLMGAACRSST